MTVEQWEDYVDLSAYAYHKWPEPQETPEPLFHGWTWTQDTPKRPWRLKKNHGPETITWENWNIARQKIVPCIF